LLFLNFSNKQKRERMVMMIEIDVMIKPRIEDLKDEI